MSYKLIIINIILAIAANVQLESNGGMSCRKYWTHFYPCTCTLYGEVNCIDYSLSHTDVGLENIFTKLSNILKPSEKHFKSFRLAYNDNITEIKANTFKDITFDEISIERSYSVHNIHPDAFNGTNQVTERLYFGLLFHPVDPRQLFEGINKFKNLKSVQLFEVNITEVPSDAFNISGDVHLDQLEYVLIDGPDIRKLGERAFATLRNLKKLYIGHSNIDYIPEYAFQFDHATNNSLEIELDWNYHLESSGFHNNSLAHLNRPTKVQFGDANVYHHIKYLDEDVFRKFLEIDPRNTVSLMFQPLNCSDCRNLWINNHKELLPRIIYPKCSNGKKLNDPDNFEDCL